MKMTQTWGWLAAGVLAAGLNASYHDGGLQWAHRVVDQVTARADEASNMLHDLASGRADLFLTEARLFLHGDEAASTRLAATAERVQIKIVRRQAQCARAEARAQVEVEAEAEAMAARHEAALGRAEAERERIEAARQRAEARWEADRDRVEVRLTRLRMPADPSVMSFVPPQPPCPRVRVRLPRMPKIDVSAPAIHVDTGSAEPI